MNPTLLVLLYLYFVYFAGVPAWRYIRVANRLHRASGWVEVEATLKDARLLLQKAPSGLFGRVRGWLRMTHRTPCFWAVYEMEGRHFGCQWPTLYPYATRHERQLVRQLEGEVGRKVKLFVDPTEPHRSCYLAPTRHRTAWLIIRMIFAVACAAIAAIAFGGH